MGWYQTHQANRYNWPGPQVPSFKILGRAWGVSCLYPRWLRQGRVIPEIRRELSEAGGTWIIKNKHFWKKTNLHSWADKKVETQAASSGYPPPPLHLCQPLVPRQSSHSATTSFTFSPSPTAFTHKGRSLPPNSLRPLVWNSSTFFPAPTQPRYVKLTTSMSLASVSTNGGINLPFQGWSLLLNTLTSSPSGPWPVNLSLSSILSLSLFFNSSLLCKIGLKCLPS